MSRLLPTLVAFPLLSLALAPAAPVPPAARQPVLFFPTTRATWVYRFYGVGDEVGFDITEVVMSGWEKGGVRYVRLGSVIDSKKQASGIVIAVAPAGLTEGHEAVGGGFVPMADVLRLPCLAGRTWVLKRDSAQADKEQRYTSRGPEEVEVPAGKFNALRVDTEFVWRDGSPSRKDRTWYAPGVGVVKWADAEGRSKVLRAFDPGR